MKERPAKWMKIDSAGPHALNNGALINRYKQALGADYGGWRGRGERGEGIKGKWVVERGGEIVRPDCVYRYEMLHWEVMT